MLKAPEITLSDLSLLGVYLEDVLAVDSESDEYFDMIVRLVNTFSKTCFQATEHMQQYNVYECWKLFGESLAESGD